MEQDEVRGLLGPLALAARDEELSDRLRTVDDTAAARRAGRRTTGYPRLVELIDKTVVDRVLEWLHLHRTVTSVTAAGRGAAVPRGDRDREGGADRLTEVELAERLAMKHGQDLRYCAVLGGWHVFDGRRFERDERGRAIELAKDAAEDLWSGLQDLPVAEQRAAFNFARNASSARGIDATLKLARSIPEIATRPGDFDRDPYLLNVANGTIDLRDGRLRPHDRQDLLTQLAPVEYDQQAPCPLWEGALQLVFGGDAEMIGFFQRAVGYSITGSVQEQVLLIAWGDGENGKTTVLETVRRILGDYGYQADPELLVVHREGAQHPTALASLRGRRLVTTVETGEGRRLAESWVKYVTGGEQITARKMHRDFFSYDPTHKLWLATNHRPVVRGTDHGLWRRLRLIPFGVRISEVVQRDECFAEKLWSECSGILAWAVRGALDWRRRGLDPPRSVMAATAEYREASDVVQQFIAERCVERECASVAKGELYAAYLSWCDDTGEMKVTKKAFGQRLISRGYRDHSTGEQRQWLGIGLRVAESC